MHEQSVTVASGKPLSVEADGGWAQLHGDCARMVPHWAVPATVTESVPASLIHGVVVPSASARLVGAMPEYGA
ncbi:hypothetical protein GCM10010329_13340 [Streptomyces spiroverticillatus]|uniref:Uncharacterized protein n=1 Tax=Streptomyces finlayi TaxID=67296 RepID=A0A918WWX9_9ACTN|nr:hypothetical protein [Streptomyces finlayi]GGZ93620.1 hypothetical protein GCM10010329_13340 [Streptomyces spiroverticillatus]GHC92185.1 hypothetical protein GCM10010334_27760 [Streptomyces finlayi]